MRVTGGVMRMPGVGVRFGRAVLFEFIECLFIGVVLLCEFGFIEVIRWIVIAEVRVFEDIFFGFESCVTIGVFEVGCVVRCLFGVFFF